jgi:hypothetical protein
MLRLDALLEYKGGTNCGEVKCKSNATAAASAISPKKHGPKSADSTD